jgi:hypothetical protein
MTQKEDFFGQMSAEQALAEQKLKATRALLVSELRAAGVARAKLFYEGYGDDGNVEDVILEPSHILLPASLQLRLEGFGWEFSYSYNPGLEIDCGGGGEMEWDLQHDIIDLSYSSFGDEMNIPEEYKGQ